jgi:prepilin-type N-terminal cleavage/methylation domain-containing protein
MRKRAGFTLIELLIYIGIFAILAVSFSSILVTFSRVTITQSSRNEVSSQLSFVIQRIQRMVSESSHVVVTSSIEDTDLNKNWDEDDNNLGTAQKYLVLKLPSDDNSPNSNTTPTIIYTDGGVVKVRKGRGSSNFVINDLTTNKVVVDKLEFTKFVDYPGRDLVEIHLTLSYNSEQEQLKVSRKLVLGTSKAYAAIFDTDLLPGTDGGASVGQLSLKWADAHFSGDLTVGQEAKVTALKVSDNGTPMNAIHNGQLAVNPPTISGNSNKTFDVNPPTGVILESGDRVFLTPHKSLEEGLVFVGATINAGSNKIEVTIRNTASKNVNGASRNWYYLLIK